MTACLCACCAISAPCAHVLALSRDDSADATRLAMLSTGLGLSDGAWAARPASAQSRREPDEPTVEVRCRQCKTAFSMFAWLAAWTAKWSSVLCPRCAGVGA